MDGNGLKCIGFGEVKEEQHTRTHAHTHTASPYNALGSPVSSGSSSCCCRVAQGTGIWYERDKRVIDGWDVCMDV